MARRGVILLCSVIFMMFVCVRSDFAQDKKQCQNQLLSLSSCLGYVTGDVKVPSQSCCTQLRKDITNNTLCLCILIRDRNEPGLGFKINSTLAFRLPSICGVKTNATSCPDLLHLPPNSPEAQVFEQLGNSSSAGDISTSSSSKLRGFGRVSTAEGLPWLVLSVFIGSIW